MDQYMEYIYIYMCVHIYMQYWNIYDMKYMMVLEEINNDEENVHIAGTSRRSLVQASKVNICVTSEGVQRQMTKGILAETSTRAFSEG